MKTSPQAADKKELIKFSPPEPDPGIFKGFFNKMGYFSTIHLISLDKAIAWS